MNNKRLLQTLTMAAASFLVLAINASANIIYTTDDPGTAFVSGNIGATPLSLNSLGGQAGTLVFTPNSASITGVPSGINLGSFLMSCPTCTQSLNSVFGAFTFNLLVHDITDNATGRFVGSSLGGTVSSITSTVEIAWVPDFLGPGTNNALTGDFGNTFFERLSATTIIVAPNSGTPPGLTTIQSLISSTVVPEPATFAMVGGALLGLGLLRSKKILGKL